MPTKRLYTPPAAAMYVLVHRKGKTQLHNLLPYPEEKKSPFFGPMKFVIKPSGGPPN